MSYILNLNPTYMHNQGISKMLSDSAISIYPFGDWAINWAAEYKVAHYIPFNSWIHVEATFTSLRHVLVLCSGCNFQGFSWSPSNGSLNRSKLASTRLCNNQIIIIIIIYVHFVSATIVHLFHAGVAHAQWGEVTDPPIEASTGQVSDARYATLYRYRGWLLPFIISLRDAVEVYFKKRFYILLCQLRRHIDLRFTLLVYVFEYGYHLCTTPMDVILWLSAGCLVMGIWIGQCWPLQGYVTVITMIRLWYQWM